MMADAPSTDEVLEFLNTYRTRKEVEEKFDLSNTESYNLLKWLRKAKLIKKMNIRVSGKTNRTWYYVKLNS